MLDELAPQEEVVESKPAEAQSFIFETNKERELPIEASVEYILAQAIEDPILIEQPPVLILVEAAPMIRSPPTDQVVTPPPKTIYQTPPATQNTPESIARFYEYFVVKVFRPSTGAPLCCGDHPFFADILGIL